MNNTCTRLAAVTLVSIGLFSSQSYAVERTVDCDKGQSLQDAVEVARGSADNLSIYVSGYCDELVEIERDDVSIESNNNATVEGIVVQGGRRIGINSLTVTGPGVGIEVAHGDVEIFDVNVTGNAEFGLRLDRGSDAVVSNSTISGNAIGISVRNGSNVIVESSDISNNNETGIEADNGANVVVDLSSTINNNVGGGIDASLHTSILINAESSITDNGNYGIKLQSDSGFRMDTDVLVSGNGVGSEWCDGAESCGVICTDIESSALIQEDIDDLVVCTDFNQVTP